MSDAIGMSGAAPGGDPGKRYRARVGIPVVPAMDGFRAFGILAIVAFHLIGTTIEPDSGLPRVLLWGTLPNLVEALFIVSGFVVFLPTVARDGHFGSLAGYALRRGARLLPAYWAMLVVVLVLIAAWPVTPEPTYPTLTELGLHAGALQMPAWLVDDGLAPGFGLNPPVWTLSIEVTFYLLLPLVASAYFRHPLIGLAAAAAITIAWKVAIVELDGVLGLVGLEPKAETVARAREAAENQFPTWAFSFALGMTGAWAFVRLRAREAGDVIARRAAVCQAGGLLCFAVSALLIGRYAIDSGALVPNEVARREVVLSLFFSASLAIAMVATALAPSRFQLPFSAPLARWLGDISYGIYLIHLPLIFLGLATFGLTRGLGAFGILLVTVVPLAVLYGWASARFLEQPIRRWAHRFGRRAATEPGSAVPVRQSTATRSGGSSERL